MTWSLRDGSHEGGVGTVLIDGSVDWGRLGRPLTLGNLDELSTRQERAWSGDLVRGWMPGCVCGWRGSVVERSDGAWSRGGPASTAAPAWLEDEVLEPEWRRHVLRQWNLDALARSVMEQAAAARRLDDVVAAARASGASWHEIATALGTSRQAAHQRWGRRG